MYYSIIYALQYNLGIPHANPQTIPTEVTIENIAIDAVLPNKPSGIALTITTAIIIINIIYITIVLMMLEPKLPMIDYLMLLLN